MTRSRFVLLAAALAALVSIQAGCDRRQGAPAPAGTGSSPALKEIVFLHINDTHGKTQGTGASGGYGRLSTLVDECRAKSRAERVFLVDCGDVISRGDALTRRTLGQANVKIMNYLKFDLWVPGNGDFYDSLENLQQRIAQGNFKTLAANVIVNDTGQTLADPYTIVQAGDIKVAMLGLCFIHEELPSSKPVTLKKPIDIARELVPRLREQADVVVAVTHIGYPEDLRLANEVPGIDLILGAHTHTLLPNGQTVAHEGGAGTLVCQAGDELNYLGQATLKLDRDAAGRYRVASAEAKTIPLDQSVKIDPKVTALIARLSQSASRPAPQPQPAETP